MFFRLFFLYVFFTRFYLSLRVINFLFALLLSLLWLFNFTLFSFARLCIMNLGLINFLLALLNSIFSLVDLLFTRFHFRLRDIDLIFALLSWFSHRLNIDFTYRLLLRFGFSFSFYINRNINFTWSFLWFTFWFGLR